MLAALAGACRVGDLVGTRQTGPRLEFTVQPSRADTGTPITPPVQVTVRDATGRPDTSFHDSVALDLGSNPGGATLVGTPRARVEGGVATFANVRINKPGDGYVLRATAPGRAATMSAAFAVDPIPPDDPPVATRLAFTVQPANTQVGTAIAPAIRVAARDDDGEIVTSFAGTISLAIGTNPGGGRLSGTTSSVASGGAATFNGLTIDRAGNGYTLTAAASGLSGATSVAFNITATPPPPPPPPPPTQLAFTVQPSNTVAGGVITPAIQVAARDASGNLVPGFTGTITIAFGANPGGGQLSGTTARNATNGVATFDNLQITQPGSGYTLRATAAGLTAATSGAFNITAPPPPPATQLVFTVQPSNAERGQNIKPDIKVAARDASGNLVSSFNGAITIAIAANPGGGTLSGGTTKNASNGVATFNNLRINEEGSGYTLRATSGNLTAATSVPFNITDDDDVSAPTSLRFSSQPTTSRMNQPISPSVRVQVLDASGSVSTTFTGPVTIDLAPNTLNAAVYGTVTVNAVAGEADFTDLRVNFVGVDFRLRAAFAGQAPIVTSNAFAVLP